MIDLEKEIEKAKRLYTEAMKNVKPHKLEEKIMFVRGIPIIISGNSSARAFEIEYLWLNPEILREKLGIIELEEKPRPTMYS